MTQDLLEIRFHGGNINPSAIRAGEVAELIAAFEKAIVSAVKERYPDLDTDKYAFLSFQTIKNESLGLGFLPNQAEEAYDQTFLYVVSSINENDYNNLPYQTLENLQVVSRFTKKHNCDCDYIYRSEVLAKITPTTVIDINASSSLKGETTIYGQIERVGGAKPRITFKDYNGSKIYFEVTQTLAKKLASRLYEDIALNGTATWDNKTYRVLDFKITDIVDLNKNSLVDTFAEIQNIISNHWENFDDIETLLIEDE